MIRCYSVHATCLAVSATILSVALQSSGEFAAGAHAAGSKPATSVRTSTAGQPMTGKLQGATKHALTLVQAGSKKLTHVRLNASTQYIVKGKRVAKPPAFTRGLLISVITTQAKGPYTAHIVIVGPNTPPPPMASGPPSTGSTAEPAGTSVIAGAVTLASIASVTVKTPTGTKTVKLTAATLYVVKGKTSSTEPVLHAGEKVSITAMLVNGALVGQVFTIS